MCLKKEHPVISEKPETEEQTPIDNEKLKQVTGGAFKDLPTVDDNDYDDSVKSRV